MNVMRQRGGLLAWSVVTWALACLAIGRATQPAPSSTGGTVDYARDVLPILAHHCFPCHGVAEQKAGLRLDQRESALRPARSGAIAIRPGKSKESELIRRIFAVEETERMPPPRGKALTAAQKEMLRRWIDEGAEYQQHWAFVKPVRPSVPKVQNTAWVRNDIDAFVLARLEKAGLTPSPRADRATLIRRLSFDLRGLPPTLEEVDAFLKDEAADAYEKLVDRLLSSPRYGEKMAQLWLDLARFGDTSGYHEDSYRQMWLWRDWVIAAFNANMPFDRFTIEQLAGDLLPNPTLQQRIATGFQRNTRFNEEAGVDPEEFVVRYTVDRTNTVGKVWLGLTLGCAECHNHKYDPITHKEYYQLYAFFTGIKEPMVSGNHNVPLPPLLKVPTPEQEKALAKWQQAKADAEESIAAELKRVKYVDPLEGDAEALKPRTKPVDVLWLDDELPADAQVSGVGGGKWTWVTDSKETPVFSGSRSVKSSGTNLHIRTFSGTSVPLPIHGGDKVFAYVWLDPQDPPRTIQLQYFQEDWEHRVHWGEDLGHGAGAADVPGHHPAGPLPPHGKWARLEVAAENIGLKPGVPVTGMAIAQFGGSAFFDHIGVATLWPPDERERISLALWTRRAAHEPALPKDIQTIVRLDSAKRNAEQKKALRDYYVRFLWAEGREIFEPLEKELEQALAELKRIEDAIPYTLITEEMPEPRPAHVLLRGDFQQKGEKVAPGVPSVFPPLPKGTPRNRLALARWLVHPDHPLTARVTVNRLWAQMFGTGIVRTIGDFGTQGDYPSHPELLDWLAMRFVASGWDVKAVLRTIALSNTYQQSSLVRAGSALKIDPHNRLLSRMPRFRLTAEEIRDNALSIAGLLSGKIGGRPALPYQPADYYKGKMEAWLWEPSPGEEQYRRGLYTFWRRTNLHPMFALFDAPTREECVVARPRTNTPLQALVTLNDPTFVEAARVFAQRILTEGPADETGRLTYAFRVALARTPTPAELKTLQGRLHWQLEHFAKHKQAAAKLVDVGQHPRLANLDVAEHAAWTAVASIILNLDETIMRE